MSMTEEEIGVVVCDGNADFEVNGYEEEVFGS